MGVPIGRKVNSEMKLPEELASFDVTVQRM